MCTFVYIDSSDVFIKLIVYDFDQTITKSHLYHELNGGRLHALKKLSNKQLIRIFGGEERINRLDEHFRRVSSSATIAILSFGYCDVIRKALQRMTLPHFEQCKVIGNDSKALSTAGGCKAKCIVNLQKELLLDCKQVNMCIHV